MAIYYPIDFFKYRSVWLAVWGRSRGYDVCVLCLFHSDGVHGIRTELSVLLRFVFFLRYLVVFAFHIPCLLPLTVTAQSDLVYYP